MRDLIAEFAPLLLSALGALVAELLRRLLNVQKDSEAGKAINLAVERAAARVYEMAISTGTPLSDHNGILRLSHQAMNDAAVRIPDAMARRGVSDHAMLAMVQGEFARNLVADPTVQGPLPRPVPKEKTP